MSKLTQGLTEIAIGTGLVALDIFAPEIGIPATVATILGGAGGGLIIGGIGTSITPDPLTGTALSSKNPVAPWQVVYGQTKTTGTLVYIETTGESDKYLHLVWVLACHPCQSVDAIYFDNRRVILAWNGNIGSSVSPTQWNSNISSISRTNDVVTVVLATAFTGLETGDTVIIQNVSGDLTLNGEYAVQVVNSNTFTYLNGGSPVTITNSGQAKTTWPDYGDTVHCEYLLGDQTSTFPGLLATDGTGSNGLWTENHLLQGRTCLYLRLKYGGNTYASGLPSLSFLLSGKNDIYDPRNGSNGYTANSALCIADYLNNDIWGYKAAYQTEIPDAALVSSANICDEAITLSNGNAEPRYTCNGSFNLSTKRGEVLQSLLSSCGGRITYIGGQFAIQPASWVGPSATIGKGAASVSLTVITSHVPGPQYNGIATIMTGLPVGYSPGALYDNGTPMFDGSAWTQRTNTYALDSSTDVPSLVLTFAVSGTLSGSTSPADQFLIYDAYVDVTYDNGVTTTTSRYRPTKTQVIQNGSGDVQNAVNAIDGDPTTYALVERSSFSSLGNSPELQAYGFISSDGQSS